MRETESGRSLVRQPLGIVPHFLLREVTHTVTHSHTQVHTQTRPPFCTLQGEAWGWPGSSHTLCKLPQAPGLAPGGILHIQGVSVKAEEREGNTHMHTHTHTHTHTEPKTHSREPGMN